MKVENMTDAQLFEAVERERLKIAIARVLQRDNPQAWRRLTPADKERAIVNGVRRYKRYKVAEARGDFDNG